MKKLLIIVVAWLLTGFANAPGLLVHGVVREAGSGTPLAGVEVRVKGEDTFTRTNKKGEYRIQTAPGRVLVFRLAGYEPVSVRVGSNPEINMYMAQAMENVVAEDAPAPFNKSRLAPAMLGTGPVYEGFSWNTESYTAIHDNIFHSPLHKPLSTFAIDVDAASYSNVRRFLNNGIRPPKDAVRIEELINYFDYDYPAPAGNEPFAIYTEVGPAPWQPDHRLVHIGIRGREIPAENLPASNLVFLIDVSGSMNSPNKLPLLKSAFRLLVDQLRPQDRVAIVVYAGAAGVVLPSTPGNRREEILAALQNLSAGGSTAGGEGIRLAYRIARDHFMVGGNNRIILATDGDFNVGPSSDAEMERLIEKERESGVYLTVLGFGMGNYKDSKMEVLADKGNGNYAYIDNLSEARKVLVHEFGGTLFTIAKDVKIQVEFNPARVQAYRLIGYENRLLNDEDFNNDQKDAGELGAGHTVTALYEIVPVGVSFAIPDIDPLKYQAARPPGKGAPEELLTVKLRYKEPDGDTSLLVSRTLADRQVVLPATSNNFRWAAAIAGFGMLLRDSEYKGNLSWEAVTGLARSARGADPYGYRNDFIRMVENAALLAWK